MACQLSSLPHDLVPLVLDAVSEHDMRSLAVVSSDLSQAAHPRVQGAALDDFLGALIDVTQAYFEHDEFDPDFDWSDRCEWVAEWDSVPVDRVVAWLQALPKDEDGIPVGADSSLYSNNDVRSILEALFTHWQLYNCLFPGDHGWSTDEYAHREETDALEACLSSAVTSLRVPELDDGATRMRHLCERVCAMPRPPRD
jgi:hypothetical protein